MNQCKMFAKIVIGGVILITKPTYAIHVWWSWDRTQFSVIENMGVHQAKMFYEYHKMIPGKSATVFVFFNDYDLRYSDLIAAATRFMRGDYVRIDVDLYNLSFKETKGADRTNPRQ